MASKKKDDLKKQVLPLFQEDPDHAYWQYKQYDSEQTEKVDHWLNENAVMLRPLLNGPLSD